MNLVVTITVRCSAVMDPDMEGASKLSSDIETAVWDALEGFTEDITHLDVEIDPEQETK